MNVAPHFQCGVHWFLQMVSPVGTDERLSRPYGTLRGGLDSPRIEMRGYTQCVPPGRVKLVG